MLDHVFTDAIGALRDAMEQAFLERQAFEERFQADVPGSMFVYPVRAGVPLPEAFVKHAVVPKDPLSLPAAEIDANRDRWLAAWTDVVVR